MASLLEWQCRSSKVGSGLSAWASSFTGIRVVEAFKSFQVALDQYKDNPQFLVYMAEAAFESSQYQEAMKLLEQARLIDNKRSDIYHLVGRTAYAQGQYDSAIRNLKQAIKLDGQDTGHRYWLARAHMSRGRNKSTGRNWTIIQRKCLQRRF